MKNRVTILGRPCISIENRRCVVFFTYPRCAQVGFIVVSLARCVSVDNTALDRRPLFAAPFRWNSAVTNPP